MRITNNMLVNNMINYLQSNLNTMSKYYNMNATGKLIQKASEDPVVATRSQKLKTDLSVIAQYRKNADSTVAWMTATESAIKNTSDVLIKIRTLAVQASTGTLMEEDRQSIASQVKQLKDEIVNLANSTYSGRYLFSGYKSDTPLMDENGFFNVVVSQLEKINYEVGITNKIQVNVTGDSLFNLSKDVNYLPARSALIQDLDDLLAMIDAKATVTSSIPLSLTGPGVFDMSGVNIDIELQPGSITKNINFDEANVQYVNQMTSNQIIDYVNKKLGLDGTASLDKNGNIVIKNLRSGATGITAADAAGAAGSAAKLFGTPTAMGANLIGTKSLTEPTVDVSAYNPFSIIVDRSADPIVIDLASLTLIDDPKNARLEEISAEINRQIAVEMANSSSNTKWAKCTVEDGRLCLTSESFGSQSYIELSGGQEIHDLFGVTPAVKQGNAEQQGKLVGSRDFREPVVDVTVFRNPSGDAPMIKVLVNGIYNVNITLDDGDPTIDPHNMTLRQIMKKIDDCFMGYGTCDIDNGKLVIRTSQGGQNSSIEMASIDEDFMTFLFGTDPVISNGADDPSHGFYKSGIAFKPSETMNFSTLSDLHMDVVLNGTTENPITVTNVVITNGSSMLSIVDQINTQLRADPVISATISDTSDNQFSFAILVDGTGKQMYPPINGQSYPSSDQELYLVIQSHTWGTGSSIKLTSADDIGMSELFGKGTINAPIIMGGADGFQDEVCKWLDVADEQLANINRLWTDLGARMNRAELTQERLDMDKIVYETLQASNDDVDIAHAATLFKIAELVYNTSLSMGARVIQPTLLDFLR